MAKFQSPLLGYNNNVRHKGRVFHIQTEDSGVNHPHIITHLFMDGGRILKSVKRSYAEHVGTDGMNETVRQMMKEQHKAMFIALRDGQFDAQAFGGSPQKVEVPAIPAAAEAPAAAASPAALQPSPDSPAAFPAEAPTTTDAAPPPDDAPPTINEQHLPPPARISARPAPRLELAEVDDPPATAHDVSPADHGRTAGVVMDYAAVERDARVTPQTPAAHFQTNDLPPPPKNLFTKEPGTGTYRSVAADAPREEQASATKSVRPAGSGTEARYAPARPAAIFGAKPAQQPSIFSDDLVSDKSLDEVILSYLAEDLEPPRRK